MASLLDHLQDHDDHAPGDLRELRLSVEPTTILLFTQEVEEARLHYESDEAIRSYITCPGNGCPYCDLGSAPQDFLLLPVYDLETQAVEVLRVSKTRGPGSLRAHLLPHLKDPAISQKVLMIFRKGARYGVTARPLAENADRGVDAIKAFKSSYEGGAKLSSAFLQMTPEEIGGVERVRRKLDAIGGPSRAEGTQAKA